MRDVLLDRFLRYVKINTRSDEHSQTVPSTKRQWDLANLLFEEVKALGLADVKLDDKAIVTATLPSNTDKEVRTIGFIAHMDTADFNSEAVKPRVIENYDGQDIILNEQEKIITATAVFPNLKNYIGKTLVVTDGLTLLGADDKAGIAEIMTAMEYLIQHPEIKHGSIRIAFTIDEEIGTGANSFDVKGFNADFAYTVDGSKLGELEYETFNAAQADITLKGVSVHPGSAKDTMVNTAVLAYEYMQELPTRERPETTEGYEGFYLVTNMMTNIEAGQLRIIVRDHDHEKFVERKQHLQDIATAMNQRYGYECVSVQLKDTYYNMKDIIEQDMSIVDLAQKAMAACDVTPILQPIRGGTDGSRLSYMGLPTPNLFTGGENYHGKHEFAVVETMEKAVEVIVKIAELNAN